MIPIVTLLTDFGHVDPFVGVMKAVILTRAPQARLIDLTHDVAPQNILQGAFALAAAVPYCPSNTVHLAVVDPGVGSPRNAVVVQTHRARYVAPDNGLLTLALEVDAPLAAWRLTRSEFFLPDVSATFHGRDVFAPVAAHLACGRAAADMGEEVDVASLVRLPVPAPSTDGAKVRAAILYVDRFGNLITNLLKRRFPGVRGARLDGVDVPLATCYQDVAPGGALCLWGSSGYLEISVSMGSAAEALHLSAGAAVDVLLEGD